MAQKNQGPQQGGVSSTTLGHVLLASAVGSALEWYDFFIYGTASALVFGELFFPKYDVTIGTLAAYATFAVGFIARPFGGLFFGHFGDRLGRKPMLVATILLWVAAPSSSGACRLMPPSASGHRSCFC